MTDHPQIREVSTLQQTVSDLERELDNYRSTVKALDARVTELREIERVWQASFDCERPDEAVDAFNALDARCREYREALREVSVAVGMAVAKYRSDIDFRRVRPSLDAALLEVEWVAREAALRSPSSPSEGDRDTKETT